MSLCIRNVFFFVVVVDLRVRACAQRGEENDARISQLLRTYSENVVFHWRHTNDEFCGTEPKHVQITLPPDNKQTNRFVHHDHYFANSHSLFTQHEFFIILLRLHVQTSRHKYTVKKGMWGVWTCKTCQLQMSHAQCLRLRSVMSVP